MREIKRLPSSSLIGIVESGDFQSIDSTFETDATKKPTKTTTVLYFIVRIANFQIFKRTKKINCIKKSETHDT